MLNPIRAANKLPCEIGCSTCGELTLVVDYKLTQTSALFRGSPPISQRLGVEALQLFHLAVMLRHGCFSQEVGCLMKAQNRGDVMIVPLCTD